MSTAKTAATMRGERSRAIATRLSGPRHRLECPEQLARAYVKASDIARRRFHAGGLLVVHDIVGATWHPAHNDDDLDRLLMADNAIDDTLDQGFAYDTIGNMTANWADLGLDGSAKVRDLWAKKDLGQFASGYTAATVPPHGVRLFKVTPQKKSAMRSFSLEEARMMRSTTDSGFCVGYRRFSVLSAGCNIERRQTSSTVFSFVSM